MGGRAGERDLDRRRDKDERTETRKKTTGRVFGRECEKEEAWIKKKGIDGRRTSGNVTKERKEAEEEVTRKCEEEGREKVREEEIEVEEDETEGNMKRKGEKVKEEGNEVEKCAGREGGRKGRNVDDKGSKSRRKG